MTTTGVVAVATFAASIPYQQHPYDYKDDIDFDPDAQHSNNILC